MSENKKQPYYPPAIIPDGYERTVGIDGMEGVHPPLEFTYRAFRGLEQGKWIGIVFQRSEETDPQVFEMLAERISKWSINNPISPDTMANMEGSLMNKLIYIVMGRASADYEKVEGEKTADPLSDSEEIGPNAKN